MTDIDAIKELFEKAAPACAILSEQHEQDSEGDETWCGECCITERGEMQMGFPCSYLNLAALHNAFPALASELEAARKEATKLREALEELVEAHDYWFSTGMGEARAIAATVKAKGVLG